jgi:hypothetical protein
MTEERDILDYLARSYGRPLTPQEAWLSLNQAWTLGIIEQPVGQDVQMPLSPVWSRK